MSEPNGVLLLSTADWDLPLWTNKQHTARSLRDRGFRVLYVESTGLRRPKLGRATDRSRIRRRLARSIRPPRMVESGIFVWSPPVIPAPSSNLGKGLNWLILTFLTSFYVRVLLGRKPLIWTYNPVTIAAMRLPRHKKLIYHCVDDIAAQPGVDRGYIEVSEPRLVRSADIVFVTSRALEAKWSEYREVVYDPNCVDAAHFESGTGTSPQTETMPRPIVGFVGAVAAYKIDTDVLAAVAAKNLSLVVAGPREDDDTVITELFERDNVHYLGTIEYRDLPALISSFDVGIIPARTGKYATSMFPMKFFEYLASGVPVVSTDLPALAEYSDVAAVVPASEFAEAVVDVLAGKKPSAEERRAAYEHNTYFARTSRMLTKIGDQEPVLRPTSRRAS